MKLRRRIFLFFLVLAAACCDQSFAQQKGQGQRPQGPPPEAFAACEGKQAGDRAEFISPRGDTVTGTCQKDKDGKLVLRPDQPPAEAGQNGNGPQGQRPQGPPPEAFAACEGKQAGDRAEFISPRGDTVTGTCQEDKDGKLVLRPDHPPQQGGPKN